MKQALVLFFIAVISMLWVASANGQGAKSGGELFKQHCAVCHRNGGNFINPQKPLHKESLTMSNVKTPEDIIKVIRDPGPGMTRFVKELLPDDDATKIAEYILKTF